MPELPEVETTKNLLIKHLEGEVIDHIVLNRPNLRFNFPAEMHEKFDNVTVNRLSRHGKYMLWHCCNDLTLIIHLGMTGRFLISHSHTSFPDFYHDYKIKPEHEHCIFNLKNGKRISYYDPRRFGFFDCTQTDQLYENKFMKILGPDGLHLKGQENWLLKKFKTKNSPIKTVLLDQSIIAGVGNIYASEALWRCKIHPETPASHLGKSHVLALIIHIDNILHESIQGGGSTLKDYRKPDGDSGAYQNKFNVYDCTNQPCPGEDCAGQIQKITQAQRATFFCEACQTIL